MIKTIENAVTIVPFITDYLEVGVRNDEQLIKLAAVVQRLMVGKTGADDASSVLTEDEKKELMAVIEDTAKSVDKPVIIMPRAR